MVSNIQFRFYDNELLRKMKSDLSELKSSKMVIVPADKTTNFYKVSVDEYKQMIHNNVTKQYKKTSADTQDKINASSAKIAKELRIDDRTEKFTEDKCFVTLKDHKSDFRINPKQRLINPAKTDIGRVSKQILDRVISETRKTVGLNQWISTKDVIDWFKNIKNKGNARFIQYDIEEFYPSISEELLNKSLNFVKQSADIGEDEISIIKHARKSLLFDQSNTCWQKQTGLFDVTMGSWDGAEICQLVGLYILSKLKSIIKPEEMGLYRDDGLAAITGANGPKMDKIRKDMHKIFKDMGLKITVITNKTTVDFLDVTLDLKSNIYKPYKKTNNQLLYVHSQSNHPPSIKKNIPLMINKRLSNISCNKQVFDESKADYEAALKEAGYEYKMEYEKPAQLNNNKRKRRRNILWFNPPFSSNVKTNIGKKFFSILEKHFPRDHKMRKLFNKNTIKLSYSCLPNIKNNISSYSKSLVRKSAETKNSHQEKTCNCRVEKDCPLRGNCLVKSVVYKATLKTNSKSFRYIGLTEGHFKTRFNAHQNSFRHEKNKLSTELSKKVWELKGNKEEFSINWDIIKTTMSYQPGRINCSLCTAEKLYIMKESSKPGLLNKRSEIISKCRHKNKFLLKNDINFK